MPPAWRRRPVGDGEHAATGGPVRPLNGVERLPRSSAVRVLATLDVTSSLDSHWSVEIDFDPKLVPFLN